ncbi:MAG: glycosyltransferase family 4 protein [Candidatus Latescibacterota bacterium]
MDVGVVSERFHPDSIAIAVRMRHAVRALCARPDLRVTLYTGTRGVRAEGFRLVRTVCPPSSSSARAYPVRFLGEWALGLELFLRILVSGRQAWLITSPPFFTAWLCCLACALRGHPYALDIRDRYPQVFFAAGVMRPTGLAARVLLRAERFVYRRAALISAATATQREEIVRTAGTEDRVVLFRNGFDDDVFRAAQSKYPEFTVVFHGNLGRFQRPDLIIRLARRCQAAGLPIRFLVISWGYRQRGLRDDLPPNLEFRGQVDHQRVAEIVAQAHLGISFRSDDEVSRGSFPVKVYEFIGAGVPVLVTPVSEGGDFVARHGVGFQFAPDDEDGLFARLRRCYDHPGELQELAQRCLALRSQFARSRLSEDYAARLAASLRADQDPLTGRTRSGRRR